ncbi:MAG: hypothetical protein Q7U12_09385, partial [Undibacterium sp.]|nr:hypothetical protein [Undibacterium sp.]
MQFLLSPVVALMGRLRLIPKFLIVAMLFSAPAMIVSGLLVQELNKSISSTEKERVGVAHVLQVQDILRLAQQHRALRHLALAGNAPAKEAALKTQAEVTEKLGSFDAQQKERPEMGIDRAMVDTKLLWATLVQKIP